MILLQVWFLIDNADRGYLIAGAILIAGACASTSGQIYLLFFRKPR
jgi:hypothetical protein